MKSIIKNYFTFALCLSFVFFMNSCTNDDVFVGPGDEVVDFTTFGVDFDKQGALILVSDVAPGFYDLANLDNASIGFTVESFGESVNSVDMLIGFGGQSAVLNQINSFPTTFTIPLSQALSALGLSSDDLSVGDEFSFTFDNVVTSGGAFRSGTSLDVPVSCSSNLGGTYDYVSSNLKAGGPAAGECPDGEITGQVTFTDLGGGKYECSDLGFGQYGTSCWNDSPATSSNATFTDLCNEIISGGLDQYDLVYTWVITDVSGPNLSISWSNDYDDSGDVVITRPDGTDWPPLFTK